MSKRIHHFAPTLKLLCKLNYPRKKRWLKKNLDNALILCFCECALNVLKGNVTLDSKQKKMLAKYKEELRLLADRETPIKTKKKIIQDGGFIRSLLGPIVSILSGLLGTNK